MKYLLAMALALSAYAQQPTPPAAAVPPVAAPSVDEENPPNEASSPEATEPPSNPPNLEPNLRPPDDDSPAGPKPPEAAFGPALPPAKPATPPAAAAAPLPPPKVDAQRSRFMEISPTINDVELIRGPQAIEVYVDGEVALDCFDAHDYVVEKGTDKTTIVPRFRSTNPDQPCKQTQKHFRHKVADLDLNAPSSLDVEVLGFYGWHERSLKP